MSIPHRPPAHHTLAGSWALITGWQVVNAVANGVPFGRKEPFMVPLNDVLQSYEAAAASFFRAVSVEDADSMSQRSHPM